MLGRDSRAMSAPPVMEEVSFEEGEGEADEEGPNRRRSSIMDTSLGVSDDDEPMGRGGGTDFDTPVLLAQCERSIRNTMRPASATPQTTLSGPGRPLGMPGSPLSGQSSAFGWGASVPARSTDAAHTTVVSTTYTTKLWPARARRSSVMDSDELEDAQHATYSRGRRNAVLPTLPTVSIEDYDDPASPAVKMCVVPHASCATPSTMLPSRPVGCSLLIFVPSTTTPTHTYPHAHT